MIRLSAFPILFGGFLVAFTVGFYNRRKLFPEVDEINHQKTLESRAQAVELRSQVAAKIELNRTQKHESR